MTVIIVAAAVVLALVIIAAAGFLIYKNKNGERPKQKNTVWFFSQYSDFTL